jgi:hypothetical protein
VEVSSAIGVGTRRILLQILLKVKYNRFWFCPQVPKDREGQGLENKSDQSLDTLEVEHPEVLSVETLVLEGAKGRPKGFSVSATFGRGDAGKVKSARH